MNQLRFSTNFLEEEGDESLIAPAGEAFLSHGTVSKSDRDPSDPSRPGHLDAAENSSSSRSNNHNPFTFVEATASNGTSNANGLFHIGSVNVGESATVSSSTDARLLADSSAEEGAIKGEEEEEEEEEKGFDDSFVDPTAQEAENEHTANGREEEEEEEEEMAASVDVRANVEPRSGREEEEEEERGTEQMEGGKQHWENFSEDADKLAEATSNSAPAAKNNSAQINSDLRVGEIEKVVDGAVREPKPAPSSSTKHSNWEQFDELPSIEQEGTQGAVCANDAFFGDGSQWKALKSEESKPPSSSLAASDQGQGSSAAAFRKTQSMRATTNRRIQIVDSLRQRRLSISSLDREPRASSKDQFSNEDDLTRQFTLGRQWHVFVKQRKRVPGTRTKWHPALVTIRDGLLTVKAGASQTSRASVSSDNVPEMTVLYEVNLCHSHLMTRPVSRAYDRRSKLHQVKLQQGRITEKRTFKRWLFVEHVSVNRTLVKLGSPDLKTVEGLSEGITEAVRSLPVTRQPGVAYRMNEVFVEIKDNSEILTNCDGTVLERKSLNRVYVQAFLNGSPECKVVLNDIEALLLQGKSQLTQSMSRQVRLYDVVLHPCVDTSAYRTSRELKFHPLDGCPFEVMRCSIDPSVSPPLSTSALMEYNQVHNTVKLSVSFSVRKKHNLNVSVYVRKSR